MTNEGISQQNIDKLNRYNGDSFDERLGCMHETMQAKDRVLIESAKVITEITGKYMDEKQAAKDWKSAAIVSIVGVVVLLGYIGWVL